MKQKKAKQYLVSFTIKGAVELEASTPEEAKQMVIDDPLGITKGDYEFDMEVERVNEKDPGKRGLTENEQNLLFDGYKIRLIKSIRERTNMSLKDSLDLANRIEEKTRRKIMTITKAKDE